MPRLYCKQDPSKTFNLGPSEMFLGNGSDCGIKLDDPYLSARQCRLSSKGGQILIENVGQAPLLVNGVRVDRKVLEDGDELTVSDTRMVFRAQGAAPSASLARPPTDPTWRASSWPGSAPGRPATNPATPGSARLISSRDPSVFYAVGEREVFIGKGRDCDIYIPDEYISERQCRVYGEKGQIWIENLGENPLLVNRAQAHKHLLSDLDEITVSDVGFVFHVVGAPSQKSAGSSPRGRAELPTASRHGMLTATQRLFQDMDGVDLDEIRKRSLLIVKAFEKAQKKQKRTYLGYIAIVAALALLAGAYAIYNRQKLVKQQALAETLFYQMKAAELKMTADMTPEQLKKWREERGKIEQTYDKTTEDLEIMKGLSAEDRLILRMARVFGECEVNIPEDFLKEVHQYISKWQSSSRMKHAIQKAQKHGYTQIIAETMLRYDMPPQFFYLALQESNLDPEAVGTPTRYGYAKGMWQFIPDTGRNYGLTTGPLELEKKHDPRDERHDFEKSTEAAAKYIRFIYSTDAQASGLLVMASYNRGENAVIKLIRQMHENPRDRNFWNLLRRFRHKIPQETYDYVFYIFSAAVIGENPRLFGFDFANPLSNQAAEAS